MIVNRDRLKIFMHIGVKHTTTGTLTGLDIGGGC